MIVRTYAEFRADLPEDDTEDENGMQIEFGGKNVIVAVGELLTELGYTVSGPFYLDFKGWEIDIQAGKLALICRVNEIDDWFLSLRQASSFWTRYRPQNPAFLDALKRLSQALNNDPRFHDIRWFASEEVHTEFAGASTPILGQ